MPNPSEYERTCFVIMPFGKKTVGGAEVDFDRIYDTISAPAIAAATLPEGGNLMARRTDRDFFSADISQDMFEYIEYSRVALADLTGLNANVFYELGVRHRARQAGTVILRQQGAPIPFDINQIKAFPYEYDPEPKALESRALLTRILTESLAQNRLDSPVQRALRVQRRDHADIEGLLRAAENALRADDKATAAARLRQALAGDPRNPALRVKAGILEKELGRFEQAREHFQVAVDVDPAYSEAHRELGVVQNKLWEKASRAPGMASGQEALERAIDLDPQDFDAHASLGGIFKRLEQWEDSLRLYRTATDVSGGHPYPLLNEIKVQARIEGRLALDEDRELRLARAERALRAQVGQQPHYNAPWSCFDLAEIRLYAGDEAGFLQYLDLGVLDSEHDWQPGTFRASLQLLVDGGVELPGLARGLAKLDEAIARLKRQGGRG
jgi:tetratricopeptide (TPR) repeat protein